MNNKPAFKYKIGAVIGTVWRNEKDGKQWFSTNIQRVYKSGEEWKYSTSFMTNNLPEVDMVLKRCYTWIKTEEWLKDDLSNPSKD